MRKLIYMWCLPLFSLIAGCNDDQAPDCFKKAGDIVATDVQVASFHSLVIHDDIHVNLVSDPQAFVRVETGVNLIGKVKFDVVNGTLAISNDNSCNWVRGHTSVVVHISNPGLGLITLAGFGNLSNQDTLQFGSLKIVSQDSPSDVALLVSGQQFEVVSNSNSNFYIQGSVDALHVGFYYNPGIFFGEFLESQNANITHNGQNLIQIRSVGSVQGTIENSGNLEIYGNPPTIDIDIAGSGSWKSMPD